MELPKMNRQGGGMLDGIKSKLGFNNNQGYDDEYGDYEEYADDYGEYAYDDAAEGESETYSGYAPVTTRSAGTNRSTRRSYSDRAESNLSDRRRASSAHPPLVSMGDVRASTQVPDSLSRDPLPARRRTSTTNSLGRSSMGRASDYTPSGAEVEGYDAYAETSDPGATADLGKGVGSSTRSSGYDSLFNSSSMTAASSSASKSPEQPAPASAVGVSTHAKTTAASSYDPYQAYEGAGAASHKPTRNVVVISPNAYGEVESVARNLKAGDAVVLSLRNTPSQLSKRILDFSFGVASALDASVDCVADKVFAITRGSALSDAECMKLRGQGVL